LGILISGPEVLERARGVTVVALDKTGTLTRGSLSLKRVVPLRGQSEDVALAQAASLANSSEHPVSRAIVSAALARGIALEAVENFTSVAGMGISGVLGDAQVELRRAVSVDAAADETASEMLVNATPTAWFGLTDELRPEAALAVENLRAIGVDVRILSGDRQEVVDHVAEQLGIRAADGRLGPLDKVAEVERAQARGSSVAMVGDGVNDAPALATADLGIAVGHGTDMAISASDITLTSSDPGAIAQAIRLARRTRSVIIQNLAWAFGYNVLAIPLAVAGLLNPLIAAAAMAASSLFVVLNALRLRGFRPAKSR
jgi:Cu+-exporting ATPase